MTENPTPGTPQDAPPREGLHDGPRVSRDQAKDLGRLRRSVSDRKVAGVSGGLARHFDVDPVIIRVAFVVLGLFGPGIFLYGALWLLVPEDGEDEATINLSPQNRTIVLVVAAALAFVGLAGNSWDFFWVPWPFIICGALIWLVVSYRDRKLNRNQAAYGPPPGTPPGTPPTTWAAAPTAPGHSAPASGTAGYDAPAAPPAAWAPGQTMTGWVAPGHTPGPPGYAAVPPRRPRDPRKRGPILFWFTLALVALGIGVLGTLDLAGVAVADSAYPATALGLIATMLLVGSVYGRAGGLILLGLFATVGLAGATAAQHWDGEQIHITPRTTTAIHASYDFEVGELILDLTRLSDPAALDGRRIEVDGEVGHLEVIVPAGIDVDVTGRVHGPGGIDLFGEESGGIDTTNYGSVDGGDDAPHLTLDTELQVGQIEVKQR